MKEQIVIAFTVDLKSTESARILRDLARQFEQGNVRTVIQDLNGNSCGSVLITPTGGK